ncbi:hypothetical protein FJT64_024992 [Amphibalanus amphitrite]|uniref:Peptidase aspartic putative domain-containing protein n=1 Tax=Amphibalanus amphitrite TaxID=1232801 RepID=A0A6A4W903_AMPAM|nr:hypothetical protein FJT64_024992 [Amphibalanus amphitrite]
MADDFRSGPVDILIGIDQLYDVVLWDQIELDERLRAIDTVFGYVLHGHQRDHRTDQSDHHTYHGLCMEKLWDLETIGIIPEKDAVAEPDLPKPTWNESEGRYQMGLTWRVFCLPSDSDHFAMSVLELVDGEATAAYHLERTLLKAQLDPVARVLPLGRA